MSQNDDKESPFDSIILNWNRKFPIDYIWRKKYGVSFKSRKHLDMSHFDMFLDLREEKLFKMAMRSQKEAEDIQENEDLGLNLKTEKTVKLSKKDVDNEFENLDLGDFE